MSPTNRVHLLTHKNNVKLEVSNFFVREIDLYLFEEIDLVWKNSSSGNFEDTQQFCPLCDLFENVTSCRKSRYQKCPGSSNQSTLEAI